MEDDHLSVSGFPGDRKRDPIMGRNTQPRTVTSGKICSQAPKAEYNRVQQERSTTDLAYLTKRLAYLTKRTLFQDSGTYRVFSNKPRGAYLLINRVILHKL